MPKLSIWDENKDKMRKKLRPVSQMGSRIFPMFTFICQSIRSAYALYFLVAFPRKLILIPVLSSSFFSHNILSVINPVFIFHCYCKRHFKADHIACYFVLLAWIKWLKLQVFPLNAAQSVDLCTWQDSQESRPQCKKNTLLLHSML